VTKNTETLGGRIKYARERKGWDQPALAEKLSTSRTLVSGWERNLGKPRITRVSRLAETLGVSLEWLLYGDGPMEEIHA